MKIFLVLVACYAVFPETIGLVAFKQKNTYLASDMLAIKNELENKQFQLNSSKATIVKQEYTRFKDGGYRFYYETSEGQSREEVGFFRDDPKLGKVLNVHGSYGYIGPSNKKVFVKYTSDERGFRYESSSFPPVGLPSNIINQQLGLFNI